jgi:oligopeptide/dipeptide ABC transporter ATP-binding protein
MIDQPIVEVRDLRKTFAVKHAGGVSTLHALSGVNFEIMRGETLGLVGESGSGKTTAGRVLVGLIPASSGSVRLFGADITGADGRKQLANVRAKLQFVFQDPYASLNPRMRIGSSIVEPLDIIGGWTRKDRNDRVAELLELVGLPATSIDRYPHEFSGGQRQRIVIARALALTPEFIVCDEPVSALDVSMQAQIVNLLLDLQDRLGLSYLFIAHDLAVVRAVSTRVAVMYAGSIVETAPKALLYSDPRHPYSRALLDAVPRADPDFVRHPVVSGEVPSLLDPLPGCMFHPRCPLAFERCRIEVPVLRDSGPDRRVACHLFPDDSERSLPSGTAPSTPMPI